MLGITVSNATHLSIPLVSISEPAKLVMEA